MKITNGSPKLSNQGSISIGLTDIKIGEDIRAVLAAVIFLVAAIVSFFLPGTWWHYWIVGFVVGFIPMFAMKDRRTFYTIDQISTVQILGVDRVGTKDMGSSLAGAAVGGLAFGGFGAVVGAVSVGNKVDEFTDIAIKFTDGEWVVVCGDKDNSFERQLLTRLAGANNRCPI